MPASPARSAPPRCCTRRRSAPSGHGAPDLQRVERRDPRTGFGDAPRCGNERYNRDFRRADGERGAAGVLSSARSSGTPGSRRAARGRRPAAADPRAVSAGTSVRQDRDEDNPERAAAGVIRRADEDAAEAPRRRIRIERQQAVAQDASRFVELDRTDIAPSAAGRQGPAGRTPASAGREAQDARSDRAIRPTSRAPATPASSSMIGSANARRWSHCSRVSSSIRTLPLSLPSGVWPRQSAARPRARVRRADVSIARRPDRSPRRRPARAPTATERAAFRRRPPDPDSRLPQAATPRRRPARTPAPCRDRRSPRRAERTIRLRQDFGGQGRRHCQHRVAAPGQATGIPRSEPRTGARRRTPAARGTRVPPGEDGVCRGRTTPGRPRAGAHARGGRNSSAASGRTRRSHRNERPGALRRGCAAQSRRTPVLLPAPRTARRLRSDRGAAASSPQTGARERGGGRTRRRPHPLDHPERRQCLPRPHVAVRDGGKGGGRALDQRLDQPLFRDVHHRHIEQQEPAARVRVLPVGGGPCGAAEERRPINGGRRLKLLVDTLEQMREISADVGKRPHARRCHHRQRQVFQRAREGARESRRPGHRRKIRQRLVGVRIEEGPRRHRLDAQPGRRRQPFARQQRRRQPGRKLRQAEAIQPEGGAPRPRLRAHEVVGGAARRRHDQHFSGGRRLEKKTAGGIEPYRGRRRFDDSQQLGIGN